MIENIILYSILGVVGLMVLAFLTRATGKIVSTDATGRYNLRMNKLYGIMGVVALIFGLLFLIFLPLTAEQIDSGLIIGVLLMLLIFWGTGISCLLYYKNHRLSFDDQSIHVINVYGNEKEINWSDVTDLKFKALAGLLILKTDKETVKVHQHLVGLSKFIEYIENKTNWNRKELGIPVANKKTTT